MKRILTSQAAITIWLLISLSSSLMGQNLPGIPFIKSYSANDYQAGISNWGVEQDKRGFIYVANIHGLLEYDGTHWRTYPVSNGTKLRSLKIGIDGRIYVGAQNQFGYFYPNKSGTLTYTSLSDLLPENKNQLGETWRTFIIEDEVYFCTFDNIYIYDGKKLRIIDPDFPLSFSFSIRGKIYGSAPKKGLFIVEQDSLRILPQTDFLVNKTVASILPFKNNTSLIAIADDGLYLYDGRTFDKWQNSSTSIFSTVSINTLANLSNGDIAIGTDDSGLYIIDLDGNLKLHLNKGRGLNNRTVLSITEDSQGGLWVCQNNGIARIELSSPFTLINEQKGLQGTGYCSYLKEETLYMGTNNGLFEYKTTALPSNIKFIPNTLGQVYTVEEHLNKVMVGHHEGTMTLDKDGAKKISDQNGSWKFATLLEDEITLLEGNYTGFQAYNWSKDEWNNPVSISGLSESSRVFEIENNTLWMSHGYKGVYKIPLPIQDNSFNDIRFYDQNNGFPSNNLINVFKVKNRLIFSSEHGIYQYSHEKDTFMLDTEFTEILGKNVQINALKEDPVGNIYFISSTHTGILKIDRFGEYSMDTQVFNKIHPLLNDDLENISILDRRNILFGAKEGFIHYNAEKNNQLLNEIQVYIREVKITNPQDSLLHDGHFTEQGAVGANQPPSQKITLPFLNNSISISFSSPNYDEERETEYSHKLEGYESQWSEWTTKAEKEYTNLNEGAYKFKVKARNIYNIESNVSTYQFMIKPPWYRTLFAYLTYIFIGFAVIISIVGSQNHRHTKKTKVLTLNQQRKMNQKDSEMEELSEQSKAEIMKLKNESLELNINLKNKELASSTMNLIDKNQILSTLKTDLKGILDHSKSSNNKPIKDMIKKIDKSITSDQEWEHFQQYFDQVHGDFSVRLRQEFPKISPQEMKLSNYLRMNLSTKEIAQLLNITTRGVEIARYRLRKKINLTREINLTEFIGNF